MEAVVGISAEMARVGTAVRAVAVAALPEAGATVMEEAEEGSVMVVEEGSEMVAVATATAVKEEATARVED